MTSRQLLRAGAVSQSNPKSRILSPNRLYFFIAKIVGDYLLEKCYAGRDGITNGNQACNEY